MSVHPREAMLDSAIALFRTRGVADTSLRDVVDHAGAPRGSIYHHFPGGKDQLASEATNRAAEFIAHLLERADDPQALVQGLIGYWSRALAAAGYQDGCPAAAAALTENTPATRAAAGAAFERWEGILTDSLVRRGTEPARAAVLATTAIAAIEGALLLARARASDEPLRRVAVVLQELLTS